MNSDQNRLLTDLAAELHKQEDQESTVEAALEHVVEIVPEVEAASVTMRPRRGAPLETIASTDELATAADLVQYEFDEGPCVEAALGEEWHRSGDVRHDPRWPQWGPRAADLGVGSLLSVPMNFEGLPAGGINLYSTQMSAFDSREVVEFATLYASHVAMAVADARKMDSLQTAMQTRHHIGVAQGILMNTYDLTMDQSFALLRRYSNVTNSKIHEIANDIIKGRALPELPKGAGGS